MGKAMCQKKRLQMQRINKENEMHHFSERYTFSVDGKTQLQIKNHMATDIAMWSDSI